MKHFIYKKVIALGLSAVLMTVNIPVIMTGAADAPCLKLQAVSLTPENLPEDRLVTVNVSISDNTVGFCAASFGIQYDAALLFKECIAVSAEGKAFSVINNPEQNLLWFTAASASSDEWENLNMEDTMFQIVFEIPPEIEGGAFPVNFVWQGQDSSPAFWYQDKQNNIIEDIQGAAVNGSVAIHGGGEINYSSLRMNQETQEQLMIYNAATQVIWFSSNPDIASVDDNGLVTAVSAGECDIQAFIDNELQACHVTVTKEDIYSVQGTDDLILVNPQRDVILEYPNAVGEVKWTSAAPDIISVDETGKLYFMQPGTDGSARIFGTNAGKTYMKNVIVTYTGETESVTEEVQPITETEDIPVVIKGDVDSSGKLNILDVIIINRVILGKDHLTPEQNQAADFDGNGIIESNDSLAMMKKIVGLL